MGMEEHNKNEDSGYLFWSICVSATLSAIIIGYWGVCGYFYSSSLPTLFDSNKSIFLLSMIGSVVLIMHVAVFVIKRLSNK